MKLTEQQISFINKYVDETLIDKEKLIEYLEMHRTIKNEVFKKCAKRREKTSFLDESYCILLNGSQGYNPVTRDTFIRRIPFYFYYNIDGENDRPRAGLWRILSRNDEDTNPETLEAFYVDLEFMFYDLGIELKNIFNYAADQVIPSRKKKENEALSLSSVLTKYVENKMLETKGAIQQRDLFKMWRNYLRLCQRTGHFNYLPERFLGEYNTVLEKAGYKPIIYHPLSEYGVYFFREGNQFTCRGNFPCDNEGRPVLKWTSIKIENAKDIYFSGVKSQVGTLTIDLLPTTNIYLWGEENYYDEEEEPDSEWHQIYAGPQNMEFNYSALKEIRHYRKLTQKEVADAIGANVRTYQKWENNESIPDGHYLLRIMNWLQIENVQYLITYHEPKMKKEELE